MKKKHKRLWGILLLVACFGTATFLVVKVFNDNLLFFYSPTDVLQKTPPLGRSMRIGGLVQEGSLSREGDQMTFEVTDLENTITVTYQGVVPDLFSEGKGVVAQGKLTSLKTFQAKQILAKHDENYMPPEVAKSLRK